MAIVRSARVVFGTGEGVRSSFRAFELWGEASDCEVIEKILIEEFPVPRLGFDHDIDVEFT